MRNKIIFAIEICCVIAFILLFLIKHFFSESFGWSIVTFPLVFMGLLRLFVVFLLAIYSIGSLYRWLKWKITGKVKIKKKVKTRRRKRGQGMRV